MHAVRPGTVTFQNLALFPALTVLENVMVGAHTNGQVGFTRALLRIGVGREEKRSLLDEPAIPSSSPGPMC